MTISMDHLDSVQQYRRDIAHFLRTTLEVVSTLVQQIVTARAHDDSEREAEARERLIEGHLGLVMAVAYEEGRAAPLQHLKLADLIQVGNIGLLQAVQSFDFADPAGRFTPYVKASIRHAILSAFHSDEAFSISRDLLRRERVARGIEHLRAMRPRSLDLAEEDAWSLYEQAIAAPLWPSAPSGSDAERTQVETLLATLTPREQQVLRLRYGLEEMTPCAPTCTAVAEFLGVTAGTVASAERRALHKLRTLSSLRASQPEQQVPGAGRAQVGLTRQEQEERLTAVSEGLRAQGTPVTTRTLSTAADISRAVTERFLRARREQTSEQARLEAAHAQLLAQGATITIATLCRHAQVEGKTAAAFLHAQRGDVQETLRAAVEALHAQGKPISVQRLAQVAHLDTKHEQVQALVRSVGISVLVALGRCSATSIRLCSSPISIHQTSSPLSPMNNGKVRNCACRQR